MTDLPRLSRHHLLDLDAVPSTDARAGRLPGEIRTYNPTWGDWGRAGESFARDVASAAPTAILDAVDDPTLPKITNAGAQTALLFGKPLHALGIGALGLGGALADDFDLLGGEAQASRKTKASTSLTPAPQIPGYSPEQQAVFATAWDKTQKAAFTSGVDRRAAEKAVQDGLDFMSKNAERKAVADQEEYNRKVGRAEQSRDTELARQTRFADTETGKWFEENATWLPFAAAFGGGLASRAFTGPGKSALGEAAYKWALPILSGTTLSYGAQNAPEIYDMSVPPAVNPEKEAYSKYAFELPEGHPDKEKSKAYADELPRINPVKSAAQDSLRENAPMRMVAAGLEGLSLGKLGAGAAGLPGRLVNDATDKVKGRTSGAGSKSPGSGKAPSGSDSELPRLRLPGVSEKILPAPSQSNAVKGSYFRSLPEDIKNEIRQDFIAARAVTGNKKVPEAAGSRAIKSVLEQRGYNVPVSSARVKATNDALDAFYNKFGRYPDKSEYGSVFDRSTLAVPGVLGAGALGYGAMDEPQSEFADGGAVLPRLEGSGDPLMVGPLMSDVPGRTDHLNISVPEGSYIVPADLISALGEGNTLAGMKRVQAMFPAPQVNRANGGKVPIAAAGGEYVIPPETVAAIGGGDLNKGHETLDAWVVNTRKEAIQHLARIPRPER